MGRSSCKGRGVICLLLLYICTCLGKDYQGTGLWLELPSSRAVAMGGISVSPEPLAALIDPGQLLKLKEAELYFLYQPSPLFDPTFSLAWGRNGWGIGTLNWGSSQSAYDYFGNPLGDAKAEGKAVFVGKALKLGNHLSCGLSLLYATQNLAERLARGGSISISLAGNWNNWQLSFLAKDVVGKLGEDPFERKLGLKLAYLLPETILAAQWQDQHLQLGGEVTLSPKVKLRLGAILGDSLSYSWGIGLAPSDWQLDFAWRTFGQLPREFTAGAGYLF